MQAFAATIRDNARALWMSNQIGTVEAREAPGRHRCRYRSARLSHAAGRPANVRVVLRAGHTEKERQGDERQRDPSSQVNPSLHGRGRWDHLSGF